MHRALDAYLGKQALSGEIFLLDPAGQFGDAPAELMRYLEMVRLSSEAVCIHAMSDEDAVGVYLPLKGPMCLRGVLYIRNREVSDPALDALASLIAIAVERLHYVEVAQRTQVEISAERLRNSILSSLSHDLRTPLTALYGLADTLARRSDLPADAAETVSGLAAQTLRMNHLLENLLDMARLKSGKVELRKEWQLFEDVVSASLYLLRPTLAGRELKISLPADLPLSTFAEAVFAEVPKVPGTAIFMTGAPNDVPHALLHSLKHYKCLHERLVILTVNTLEEAYVPADRRIEVKTLREDFHIVAVNYGFMDLPDLPAALKLCTRQGLEFEMMDTSFFLGRETLIPKFGSELAFWREKLYISMFRNARAAADYFQLPPNRVGACAEFCVNGSLAGNYLIVRSPHVYQETRYPR